MKTVSIITALALSIVACGGGGGEAAPPATPSGPTAGADGGAPGTTATATETKEPQTVEDQIAVGQKLYGDHCASCHGAGGEGKGKVPAVVGLDKGALPLNPPPTSKGRKVQFKTAADVGAWVSKTMPGDDPGSLKEWQYWAILAFDLKANGAPPTKKLDASTAKDIVIHP